MSSPRSRQTGVVVEKPLANGRRRFALRFHAYGKRRYLTLPDGTTRDQADTELRHVLADVERGTWQPPAAAVAAPSEPEPEPEQTFHQFASEWYAANLRAWRPKTRVDYLWQLTSHLLPFFQHHRLSEITIAEVDRYREHKLAEGTLSAASINKTLTRLGQILEVAVERDLIARNPMRIGKRKLRAPRPRPVWLDRADQIEDLLAAASALDAAARRDRRHIARRTMLAVLVYGGLRIGEALALRWRDVDLAHGRLYVGEAKTDAGVRHVTLLPGLSSALKLHRADAGDVDPDGLVFPSREGGRLSGDNVRNRVFTPAVALADQERDRRGLPPLPEGLTQHKLRHTACALLFASGWELPRVMEQLGHDDSATTLRVYAHVMATEPGERDRLRALVDGAQLALTGTGSVPTEVSEPVADGPENDESPVFTGRPVMRPARFERATFRSGGGRSIP